MKIYERVVMDISSGRIIHEDSYEYDGPIVSCKGSSGGSNEVQETSQEVELSKITNEEWNRYKTTYQPLFDKLSSDISGIGTAEKNAVGGMVHAGTTKAYDAAADKTRLATGDPSSGKAAISMGDVGRQMAGTDTKAITGAVEKVDDTKVAGTQNIVNMARGDAGKSMSSLSSIAGDAVSRANQDAAFDQQSRNDNFETMATIAGAGLSAAKGYAQKPTGIPLAAAGTGPAVWTNPDLPRR